jgi:hypothetical protein
MGKYTNYQDNAKTTIINKKSGRFSPPAYHKTSMIING